MQINSNFVINAKYFTPCRCCSKNNTLILSVLEIIYGEYVTAFYDRSYLKDYR